MSVEQDKPLPGFLQGAADVAVARMRSEIQVVVEVEVEKQVEVVVERRVKEIEAEAERRVKEIEAELQKQLVAPANKSEPRGRGSVSRAAMQVGTAIVSDLVGAPNFPQSVTALAKAMADRAPTLLNIELDPTSRSVRDVAIDILAGVNLAANAEREASSAEKSPEVAGSRQKKSPKVAQSRRDNGQRPR